MATVQRSKASKSTLLSAATLFEIGIEVSYFASC